MDTSLQERLRTHICPQGDAELMDEAANALDAQAARISELEAALEAAVATITDYIEYQHDGDPWTEDARAMGEMDINDFATDGRLTNALALINKEPKP